MSNLEPIKQFNNWLQAFDYQILHNKNDVETKFIIPLFRYLGYPDQCRVSKSSVKNTATNQGKTLESFHIYFATDEITKQNADTSLIITIFLEPHISSFHEAFVQGKFYTKYLKPIFILVTDGYQINVYKCILYHREEEIFEISCDSLRNPEVATDFYKQLNFNSVKNIDQNKINLLKFNQHSFIEKSLRRHSKIHHILEQADFEPSTTLLGNCLTVVKSKALIECHLPKALSEGDFQIQFSSVTLRGLKIKLNHKYILGNLMIGLNTKPEWGCRPFVKQLDNNIFEVDLGQTTVTLSELETTDLCLCIDEVCQIYKNAIIKIENILETWNFEFIEFSGIRGFKLFSVDYKLWELMQKFAQEFNYAQGKSDWHLFYQENLSIRIGRGIRDHAFIFPQPSNYGYLSANSQINIVYEINDVHLQSLEQGKIKSWEQDIGSRGTWTARYTKQWLLEKYIPKAINYFSEKSQLSEAELLKGIVNSQDERISIKEINDIRELAPYLSDIQFWLHISQKNIAALLLRGYYQAFADLVRNTDCAIAGIDYITRNLLLVERQNLNFGNYSHTIDETTWNFKDVIYCLDEQVSRINNYEYEQSLKADLITRTFIWIIEHGKISYSQAQFNAAKQALLPLWEHSRFEMRYVYPKH